MNGKETWNRFTSYIRGACLKSTNTAEFVSNFCKMGKIDSIKPAYLTSEKFVEMKNGELMDISAGVKDYHADIFEDDSLMEVFENEPILLQILVREKIQRDKLEGIEDEVED